MAQTIEIVVETDHESVSRRLADFFMSSALSAAGRAGKFSVALSGGSTPERFYEILAEDPFKGRIPWPQVHFFWGDERCVPPDHQDSNYKMAWDRLLSKINPPPENIHRMMGEMDPEKAAADYEKELRRFFGAAVPFPSFDFILLGLGPDGHTASLFPGSCATGEQKKWVSPNHVEKLKSSRLTLTFPVLNHGKEVVFLVSGAEKAPIISSILGKGSDYPAERIQPLSGKLFWFLDREAAEKITQP